MSRVSRRTSAEDTRKPTRRVAEGEGNSHQYVRSSGEPKEHIQHQGDMMKRSEESKAKSKANSRQDKSVANSKQEKSNANSKQKKNKKTCEKPKAELEEHMKHTKDLHIQHKVNEEHTSRWIPAGREECDEFAVRDGYQQDNVHKEVIHDIKQLQDGLDITSGTDVFTKPE